MWLLASMFMIIHVMCSRYINGFLVRQKEFCCIDSSVVGEGFFSFYIINFVMLQIVGFGDTENDSPVVSEAFSTLSNSNNVDM